MTNRPAGSFIQGQTSNSFVLFFVSVRPASPDTADLVMKCVVVLLSTIGAIAPYNLPNFLKAVIGHELLVGYRSH